MHTSDSISVSIVLPAHNEGHIITDVLSSLIKQTYKPNCIYVVADNCTDNTVQLAQQFIEYNVKVFETEQNKHRKSGALNQLFNLHIEGDYILIMDADTILDNTAIEIAVEFLNNNKEYAVVC